MPMSFESLGIVLMAKKPQKALSQQSQSRQPCGSEVVIMYLSLHHGLHHQTHKTCPLSQHCPYRLTVSAGAQTLAHLPCPSKPLRLKGMLVTSNEDSQSLDKVEWVKMPVCFCHSRAATRRPP